MRGRAHRWSHRSGRTSQSDRAHGRTSRLHLRHRDGARTKKGVGTDVEHQKRVAEQFPSGSMEWMVALYHDHIEDKIGECRTELWSSRVCEYGTKSCVNEHMPSAVRPHVEVLTRRSGEAYNDYIARVRDSGDPVAIAVKIADAKDNLDRCTGKFGGYVNSNRANRYRYVLKELGEKP